MVSEEPICDLESLSELLQRLEIEPTQTIIRGSLTTDQSNPTIAIKKYSHPHLANGA